jgi:hypothetical protein
LLFLNGAALPPPAALAGMGNVKVTDNVKDT